MDDVLIVTTGGTIDKIYFDDQSDYQIGEPQIGRILHGLGVSWHFRILPLLRKDSLHITEDDRDLIYNTVSSTIEQHILITHGTDSMVQTAQKLQNIPNKTIVMTGALNPARFHNSDAEFNIGCAIGALQALPYGVFIAMNGRLWNPQHVRKNRTANQFEAL